MNIISRIKSWFEPEIKEPAKVYKKEIIFPAELWSLEVWGIYKRKTFLLVPYWCELIRVLTEDKADRTLYNLRLIEKSKGV